LFDRLIW